MNTALMQNPEVNQQFLSKIPLGRWGKVERSVSSRCTFVRTTPGLLPGPIFSSTAAGARSKLITSGSGSLYDGATLGANHER